METPHRTNSDGTIDSICPRCFVTIGTSTFEADLERSEAAHVCDLARVEHYEMELRKGPHSWDGSEQVEVVEDVG